MGTPEPSPAWSRRSARAQAGRPRRRATAERRTFAATLRALDALASAGARVSVRVSDLDRGTSVLSGDAHVVLPIGGVGVVGLLVEAAAQFEARTLNEFALVERSTVPYAEGAGVWQHLLAPALPLRDLADLAAEAGDALAANGLMQRVGLEAVQRRFESLGLADTSLMDTFRGTRGPDDAPGVAVSTAADLTTLFRGLVNGDVVSPGVSAQVSEWLTRNSDLSLVGVATGLDPFAHESDRHDLLFVNKTGREDGVRAEAGVLAGPRAGVAYAMTVVFDDDTVAMRLRAHEAFRQLGLELMEFVH